MWHSKHGFARNMRMSCGDRNSVSIPLASGSFWRRSIGSGSRSRRFRGPIGFRIRTTLTFSPWRISSTVLSSRETSSTTRRLPAGALRFSHLDRFWIESADRRRRARLALRVAEVAVELAKGLAIDLAMPKRLAQQIQRCESLRHHPLLVDDRQRRADFPLRLAVLPHIKQDVGKHARQRRYVTTHAARLR